MDQNTDKEDAEGASPQDGDKSQRAGAAKRSKTAQLQIHEERVQARVDALRTQCTDCYTLDDLLPTRQDRLLQGR